MAIINSVGNSLTGASGTGQFVGSTGSTLTTPNIGAANATSITLNSGTALSSYIQGGNWTPTFTFGTPGDLSVSYATQIGHYSRMGNFALIYCKLVCTPTFTTSSGQVRIAGSPFSAALAVGGDIISISAIAFPVSRTSIYILSSNSNPYFVITSFGSGAASSNVAPTSFTSGVQFTIEFIIPTRI